MSAEQALRLLAREGGDELVNRYWSPGQEDLERLFRDSCDASLDEASVRRIWNWLGSREELRDRLAEWLAGESTRRAALGCLCAAGEFDRALLQRILPMPMDDGLRRALVEAVNLRSPERWQDRYLLSEEERRLWQEAGAPIS